MRMREVTGLNLLMPFSHQHLAVLDVLDERLHRLLRWIEEQPETQLYHVDPPEDGSRTVYVACEDQFVKDKLEHAWG